MSVASTNVMDTPATSVAGERPISLEKDLILSSLRLEGLFLTLRDRPSKALTWLRRDASQSPELPFDPSALRYDWQRVNDLRHRKAAGQSVTITSALPAIWQNAIVAYLDLDGAETAVANPEKPPLFQALAGALRLHQWTKNILVFVPIIMAHQIFVGATLLNTLLAFFCFGLVASSIYIMNDLMDLRQDRRHPTKRHRPFASGALPVTAGLALVPLLLMLAAAMALKLPPAFMLVMGTYFVLNLGYTLYLKRKLLVDVLALSGAYTLRILAGNAAGPIELSNWLLAFSMFLFLSLALVKRYVELDTVEVEDINEKRVMGRGYRRGDLDMLSQLGVASGFAAVIVLALFVEGAGKSGLYKNRELIWLVCPIVLYVIGRIWVLAKRRELPDDPIMFIIKDWRSHLMAAIVAFIFFLAV